MLVNDKGHNPNYTKDAVMYLNEYTAAKTKLLKKKKLKTEKARLEFVNSFDWNKMTGQNPIVWESILSFLSR